MRARGRILCSSKIEILHETALMKRLMKYQADVDRWNEIA